ncbi:hypothetical protein PBY51_019489 [Eleginops maclovinus]|uniref:Uncharacterized protein n=1 Tax=Eleginops maclovinus TaxID=56733 RepID=A0AAN8AYR8_ELEMC|nr:hypothetical protein PBY51_019489 [Eleginops maclovinus]
MSEVAYPTEDRTVTDPWTIVWEDRLIFRLLLTGPGAAVLAGCVPEARIDTRVLVWMAGSQDYVSPLLIN